MEYIKIEDSGQRSFGKKSYTIIFVTGGMGYLRQENENIVCTMEDLIFIKPDNKVKIEYRKNKYPLELYVLYIGEESYCRAYQMKKQDLTRHLISFPFRLRLFILRVNLPCL